MDEPDPAPRVVEATRPIAADAADIFELIADPAQQPRWDGNDNLAAADAGQRVRAVGDVFRMTLTKDQRGSARTTSWSSRRAGSSRGGRRHPVSSRPVTCGDGAWNRRPTGRRS